MHSLGGLYATSALEPDARDAFEAHLDTCDTCRIEVCSFQETTGQLGVLTETPAPPALRSAVLSAIREIRPLAPSAAAEHLVPFARPTSRRRARLLMVAAAATLLAAVGLGGWAVDVASRLHESQTAVAAQVGVLAAPDARVYHVRLPDGATASYLVSRSSDRAAFAATVLADPGAGRTYQLWTVRRSVHGAETFVPDATFGKRATGLVWLHTDVTNAAAIGITVEPAGGSRHPTMTPFAVQQLS